MGVGKSEVGVQEVVPDFAIKFKFAIFILRKFGRVIPEQSSYAALIFPGKGSEKDHENAQIRLTQIIRGDRYRYFPANKLKIFLKHVDPTGFLRAIDFDAWLKPVQEFKAVLLRAGLIDASDPPMQPLSRRLSDIDGTAALMGVLKDVPRTYGSFNLVARGLSLMSERERQRFEGQLHRFIIEFLSSKRHRRLVGLASAILSRMAPAGLTHCGLQNLVREALSQEDPALVSIIEPLCLVGIYHGEEETFVRNIELSITNPLWRQNDHAMQVYYYGDAVSAADRLVEHLRIRPAHVGAHDVGRAIAAYPYLLDDPNSLDTAGLLRDGIIKCVGVLEVKTPLRQKLVDLMG